MQSRTVWLAFLITAAVYSVYSTIQMRKQQHWNLLNRLTPFRKAFQSGYYSDNLRENSDD